MDINLVTPNSAQTSSTSPNQARGAEFPVAKKSEVQDEPVKVAAVEKPEVRMSEEERFVRVKKASQAFFKDTFVVSDTSFSIFKDASGQYITRFTNLRDGSVTYIPEPEILQFMESASRAREALVEINA